MSRDLTVEEMEKVLSAESFGHLACTDGNRPYIVPMAFYYDNNVLYSQTMEGRKVEMLRSNPHCAFHVQTVKKRDWLSVICEGKFEELNFSQISNKQSVEAIRALIKKLSSIQDTMGIHISFKERGMPNSVTIDGKESTFFRIVIDSMSGRGRG